MFDMKKYFEVFGHTCKLSENGEDSSHTSSWTQTITEWTTVNPTSSLTLQNFNSHSAIVNERKFHLAVHPWTIHPFSRFTFAWECFIMLVFLGGLIFSPMHFFEYVDPDQLNGIYNLNIILIVKVVCIIDMVLRFFTGHLDGRGFSVSFDKPSSLA